MTGSRWAYGIALSGYFGLLALLLSWNTWLAPSHYFPVALVLIVMLVPLLVPLRGLLHGRVYTYAWTLFLALAYFTHGIGAAVADAPERLYGTLEVLFSTLLFLGALVYVRLHYRELRTRARREAALPPATD